MAFAAQHSAIIRDELGHALTAPLAHHNARDTLRHCDVISTRLADYHLFRAQRLGESQSNLVELRSPSAREPSLGLGAATTSIKLFVQIP